MTDTTGALKKIEEALQFDWDEMVCCGNCYPLDKCWAWKEQMKQKEALTLITAIRDELEDMVKYLNKSSMEQIGSGSIYHRVLQQITED